MSEINKIKKQLSGITEYTPALDEDISSFTNCIIKNIEIPAYIIATIFFECLNYKDYGKDEKIWWHTFFSYKNEIFCIHDYKFGTWSIKCKTVNSKINQISNELLGKIRCAANIADDILKENCLDQIKNKNFWIKNNYHELMSLYNYYKKELQSKLKHPNSRYYTDEILYKTIPLIISFYSFLEFFLDVVFAFSKKEITLKDFRNLRWQERFKYVINVDPTQDINPIYEDLVNIKKNIRNPIMHGLGNETGLLVHNKYEGLIPLSFRSYGEKIELNFSCFKDHDSYEIIRTFDNFIHFITYTKPYSYYILYLKASMEIPIDEQHINEIKKHMKTKKEFNDFLQTVNNFSCMVYNREI